MLARRVGRADLAAYRIASLDDPDDQLGESLADDIRHVVIIGQGTADRAGAATLPFALTRNLPIGK